MERKSLNDVKSFWEKNPLFHGESSFEPGTREFFEEHRRVVVEDCLAGVMDKRLIPNCDDGRILDLGCGPGLWTVEFLKRGANNVVAGDLTDIALKLTRKRLIAYDLEAEVVHANAENMIFRSNSFDHVNCQGVIHHTPDTEKCVAEIARVLKPREGRLSASLTAICFYAIGTCSIHSENYLQNRGRGSMVEAGRTSIQKRT